jgi:tight adherence protein C
MTAIYASLTVFVLFGATAVAVYAAITSGQHAMDERLTEMAVQMRVAYGSKADEDTESDSFARGLFRWIAHHLPEPEADSPEGEKLARTLIRAGFDQPRALRIFHFIRLSFTVGLAFTALIGSVAFGFHGFKPLLFMLIGAGAGAFLPSYYLSKTASKRKQEIASQLSDVLDLLVVCVEAGMGINEAIKIVGSETDRQKQEIGAELSMVSSELTSGSTLGQSLKNFADRTAVEDIKPLAATLVQSEKLGAAIGPALRSMSDSMRTSRRLRAEEAAAKTTVKILFPLVLFILPAMMSVIIGPAMIQIMQTLNK